GLRLAAVAFVAFCIYGYLRLKPTDAQGLLWIAVRGLLAAGLALGVAWILLPIIAFASRSILGSLLEKASYVADAARRSAAERRAKEQEEERRRRADEECRRT